MPTLWWDVLAHSPSVGYDSEILRRMGTVSPAELGHSLREYGPAELRTWAARPGWDRRRWMSLATRLLPLLDRADVDLLHDQLPTIEPRPKRRGPWVRLDSPPTTILANTIAQGRLGDCWLVAALAAIAARRPGRLESLVEALPNGCFRVRLHGHRFAPWRRISPRGVVVTGWLPTHGAVTDEAGQATLATVIEKAAAALFGGGSYRKLALDFGGRAFGLLRGGFSPAILLLPLGPALALDPRARSLAALGASLRSGHAAVASTLVRPGNARRIPREDEPSRAVAVMNGHVYAVIDVGLYDEDGLDAHGVPAAGVVTRLPRSTRPPELRVHLRNPLGQRGSGGRETEPRSADLFLSQAQFRRCFLSLNLARL